MNPFVRLPGSHPLPDELVQATLAAIESSAAFNRSPQLCRLLRHLVEATQAGRADQLRELVLGVVVFRRDPSMFDPKQDPIVRVEARRLRARLDAFYAQAESGVPVRIDLPKGGYVPVLQKLPALAEGPVPALAVLPFANLTGDRQREGFCDGLTDELIDALAQLRDAKVVARTSSFQFKDRADDVREIGRRLGVDMVLEGSVQVHGQHYRVIAQLIDARDGCHLWSQAFDAEAGDILAVQDAIARDIVRSLDLARAMQARAGRSGPAEPLIPSGTRDAEARELFDRARFIVRRLDLDRFAHARTLLEQALQRDPRFARAYLMLGLLDINLLSHAVPASGDALADARAHLERAVALEPRLGSAHAMLGWIAMNRDLDWDAAEAHYRRALAASPGDVGVHNGWGNFLAYTGRFAEAGVEYRLARELDPLHVVPRLNLALMLYYARSYDAALAEYRRVEEMDPNQVGTSVLACVHIMRNDAQQALAVAERAVARFPSSPIGHCRRAEALAFAGREREAEDVFARLEPQLRTAGLLHWARAHLDAVFGRWDATLAELALAGRGGEANFCTAAVTPYFAPLQGDPRWQTLVRDQRLPVIAASAWDRAPAVSAQIA